MSRMPASIDPGGTVAPATMLPLVVLGSASAMAIFKPFASSAIATSACRKSSPASQYAVKLRQRKHNTMMQ